jgi:hypothetical protein
MAVIRKKIIPAITVSSPLPQFAEAEHACAIEVKLNHFTEHSSPA